MQQKDKRALLHLHNIVSELISTFAEVHQLTNLQRLNTGVQITVILGDPLNLNKVPSITLRELMNIK